MYRLNCHPELCTVLDPEAEVLLDFQLHCPQKILEFELWTFAVLPLGFEGQLELPAHLSFKVFKEPSHLI